MNWTSTKAKIVHVDVKEGKTGLFIATSPDMRGLLVAEPTLDALEAAIPEAIKEQPLASSITAHRRRLIKCRRSRRRSS